MPIAEIYERTTIREYLIDPALLPSCTPVDPFGLDHDCLNDAGHHAVFACGELVCCHCSRVFWQ